MTLIFHAEKIYVGPFIQIIIDSRWLILHPGCPNSSNLEITKISYNITVIIVISFSIKSGILSFRYYIKLINFYKLLIEDNIIKNILVYRSLIVCLNY